MPIETDTATAPAYWASYLINGDASGLEPEDKAQCNAWTESLGDWYVVSTEDEEAWFSWSNDADRFTDGKGGDVVTYVLHRVAP